MPPPSRHSYKSVRRDDWDQRNHYAILNLVFMVIGFFTWMPLRLACVVTGQLFAWGFTTLLTLDVQFDHKKLEVGEKPKIGSLRRRLIWVVAALGWRLTYFGMGVYWIKKKGNRSRETRISVVAPHSTLVDAPMFCDNMFSTTLTSIGLISELKRPLSGATLEKLEVFFVDYENPESRKVASDTLNHRATSEHWRDINQIFFVEGSLHNGSNFIEFKKGAFVPGKPIQPIVIEYPDWIDILKGNVTKERQAARGNGWNSFCMDVTFVPMLLYLLTVPFVPCIMTYLPVYTPSDVEKTNPELYTNNVRSYMSHNTRLGLSNCNRRDGDVLLHIFLNHPEVPRHAYDHFQGMRPIELKYGTVTCSKAATLEHIDKFLFYSKTYNWIQARKTDLGLPSTGNADFVTFAEYLDMKFGGQ